MLASARKFIKGQHFILTLFVGIYSGWRRLRYFDLDEHQIDGRSRCLAYIEKLGDQWKVIYDLKPTADQFELCVAGYYIDFSLEQGCVSLHSYKKLLGESMQLPEVGKWTRVELSHEFDETAASSPCLSDVLSY